MTRHFLAAITFVLLGACSSNSSRNGGPTILAIAPSSGSTNVYWVCHGGRTAKWKKVATPAVQAHRRHGDRVVSSARVVGTACAR